VAENPEGDEKFGFWTSRGFRNASLELLDFVSEQGFSAAGRQIVFISHGFGGSLVKNALVTACYEAKYSSVPDITRGLIFFATPHRIAAPDTWEDIVFRMFWAVSDEKPLKSWRISELAAILKDLQVEYSFIGESWPTINVYADPRGENHPVVLSEYNNSFGGYNEMRYGRRKTFPHVTRYEDNDRDLADLLDTLKDRVSGLHAEYMQTLTRLAPALPMALPLQVDASSISDFVLNNEKFKKWDDCEVSASLILTGSAGSRKTEVFRLLFQYFRDLERNHYVTLFQFDKNDARQNSQSAFLLANTRHNLLITPKSWSRIQDMYERTVGSGRTTKEDLLLLYRSLVRSVRNEKLVIMINNPEECEDIQAFLSQMQALAKSENPVVKLLVVTETDSEAAKTLERFPTLSVDTDITAVAEFSQSIEETVIELVKQRPVLADFKSDILERVSKCDDFLQVSLLLDQLQTVPLWSSPKSMRSGINSVEVDLCKITEKIMGQDLPFWSQIALHWIVHAARPLNANELAVAVALEDGFEKLNDLDETLSHDIVGDLKQLFGPLIVIRDGEVRALHDVVREAYNKKYSSISDGEGTQQVSTPARPYQWRIPKMCINYLSSNEVQELARSPQPTGHWVSRQKGIYALTRYAAKYWPMHYQRLPDCETHAPFIAERLNDESFLKTWTTLLPDSAISPSSDRQVPTKPIHFAADLGFNSVVEIFLESFTEEQISDDDLAYALELAAKNGHSDVVEQLLGHGVEDTETILKVLDEPCRNGLDIVVNALVQKLAEQQPENLEFPSSLLGRAARNGHAAVADILLRAGAPVDAIHDNASPLHLAVTESHDAVVKVLLEGGANVDLVNDQDYTPLHLACKNADPSIVAQLLDYRAKPDIKDADGFAALHLATLQADQDSVMLLLKADAEPAPLSNAEKTPLHMACENGSQFIVEQLLAKDVDIDGADDAGASPLLLSCKKGHEEIAKTLIHKGARPDGFDRSETTPLVYAISQQKTDVATLLIEKGADVNRRGGGIVPLAEAAKSGLLPLVKLLLGKGANTNGDDNTTQPIHSAALMGFNEIIKLLLEQEDPAKIDAKDESGRTALHHAAVGGFLETVKLLLDKGADIKIVDTDQASILHEAARGDKTEVVAELLDRGADIEAMDDNKRRPLHRACDYGGTETVKLLLDRGALHDEDDRWFSTPLMLAINSNYKEISRALLQKGADPRHKNSDGDTPMHRAAWNGSIALMEMLTKDGEVSVDIPSENDETPLFRAYFYRDAARWLLDHGANPNVVSKDGTTPLMFMARKKDDKVAKLLLERGANVHAVDSDGKSALHFAAMSMGLAICNMLLENGADPNQRDENQRTPLLLAAFDGDKGICEALIKKGADIDVTDYHLNTPLQMAAYYEHPEIVKLLLEHKAQLEIEDEDGDTELLYSVKGENIESTRMLLDAGANINALNKEGDNPMLCAVAGGGSASSMVSLLLEFKADPNVSNINGRSVVHMAAGHCDPDTLEVLIKAGAELDKKDHVGRTPLHYAALQTRSNSVNTLIEAGADRDALDYMGRSLIHCAVPKYTLSDLSHLVSKVLKIRGSRPRQLNQPDFDGWSPIHWACKAGESGVIRLLKAANANPVKRDKKGWTPRHVAIFHNRRDLLPNLNTEVGERKEKRIAAPPPGEDAGVLKIAPLQRTSTGLDDDASTDGGTAEADLKTGQEHSAFCDSCYVYIWGIRFKCQDCADFDLCFKVCDSCIG
jgi:ankyrin repeat protein